uniref:Uncharacterized protein n=1 Tax=Cacopsylla melanoneura TaxID=428564 RepID=A0A8D8TCG0_9HEMI
MTTSVSRIPTLYVNNRKASSSSGSGHHRRRSNSCTSNHHRYTSEIISLDAIDSVDLERLNRKKRHRSAHSRHATNAESRQSSSKTRNYTKCRDTLGRTRDLPTTFTRESSEVVRSSKLVTCDNGTFRRRGDVNGNASSSSSDENELTGGVNHEFNEELTAVKHTFESLKQIVKSNQPPTGVLSNAKRHLKQHMEILDTNGNDGNCRGGTKFNDNARNIPNDNTRNINKDNTQNSITERNTQNRVNHNETSTKKADVTRSLPNTQCVGNESTSRLKNINKEILLQIGGGPCSKLTSPAMLTNVSIHFASQY